MAHIIEDRVLEQSTTAGLGSFTLAGAALGYRAFGAVCSVSDTVWYYIEAIDNLGKPSGAYEYGIGTYSGANTLARTTVLGSSNAGSKVDFAAGTKLVGIGPIAPSGAVSRKQWRSATRVSQAVNIDAFSPTADGTTDDLTALTAFINSAIANPGVPHFLNNAVYACSAALPTINVSGVLIYGVPGGSHDVGSFSGSVIRAKTGNSGTMLTVAPDSGGSNQGLQGWSISGVTFDCAGIAAKGLIVQSSRYFQLDTYIANATTDGLTLDVQTTLGESRDTQYGIINYRGRQVETPGGVSLRLKGDSTANTSFNLFQCVDIIHKDALAIVEENADNNSFEVLRVYRAAGGTATNSIEWQGGASSAAGCRAERIGLLSTTVAAIAKGTGTYTVAANSISVDRLDVENGTPSPTVETGASVAGPQIAWNPTITASSGSFSSVAGAGFYQLDPNDPKMVDGRIGIAITTNGTAAGEVLVPLPFTSANDGVAAAAVGYEGSAGIGILGIIGVNATNMRVLKPDSTYPGGSGKSLTLTFRYRRA